MFSGGGLALYSPGGRLQQQAAFMVFSTPPPPTISQHPLVSKPLPPHTVPASRPVRAPFGDDRPASSRGTRAPAHPALVGYQTCCASRAGWAEVWRATI